MSTIHSDRKFSITIHTDALAVIHCLRALSKFSQKTGSNQMPWNDQRDDVWVKNNHELTFHFSEPKYRDRFIAEAKRLLPDGSWKVLRTRDYNSAKKPGA